MCGPQWLLAGVSYLGGALRSLITHRYRLYQMSIPYLTHDLYHISIYIRYGKIWYRYMVYRYMVYRYMVYRYMVYIYIHHFFRIHQVNLARVVLIFVAQQQPLQEQLVAGKVQDLPERRLVTVVTGT